MKDYKELYLKLFRASEAAINILIEAQQDCEEQILANSEEQTTEAEQKQHVGKE